MAKAKTGTTSAITLPPAPKAGASAAAINANTKQVRKAIAKKNKVAREKAAAAAALKRNKAARREFSKTKVTSRKK